MGFSVSGLISGLDTDSIISKLMDIEKKPITQLQKKEAAYNVKLSAYGQMKNLLSGVRSAARNLDSISDITSYSVTSSNSSVVTADAETSAVKGTYSVEVQQIADVQKLRSVGFGASEAVGAGTIYLKLGTGSTTSITVNASATLKDVADAINRNQKDVVANVISDGSQSYLTLTSQKTGEANVIDLAVMESGTSSIDDPENLDQTGLSRLVYRRGATENLLQTQAAQDAMVTVDGIEDIKRSTNTIADVIPGVTMYLKSQAVGQSVKLTVGRSDTLFTTRVNAFINAYNELADYLKETQLYDAATKKTGALFADATTRMIDRSMRDLISRAVPGAASGFRTLAELGIKTKDDGHLEMDSSTFNAKLTENFDAVATFFTQNTTGAEGFAVKIAKSVDSLLSATSGTLTIRTNGIQKSIDSLESQISRLSDRAENTETRLKKQFTSLETVLGRYQGLSDSLTQQLSALENLNSAISKK
uniref:Flagellar hook-associated protein 2 n=1 Tax=Desulfatirhabdium butyrativorans TaxID=340467 RepID=A0A7C4MP49_9BACT